MNNKRRGFTLAETVVAIIILITAIVVSTQLLVATSAQHKTMERERVAIIEAGNVIERLAVQPWTKLTTDELSTWKLSPQAEAALPDAKLKIQIQPTSAEAKPAGRRLTVIVSYGPKKKQQARSIRLVTWQYNPGTA
ncbi:MAG: type II secretion system protein, partial [Pirellulales bacterium]|nr:type II secretion system protein [Pirellulales bacterium]